MILLFGDITEKIAAAQSAAEGATSVLLPPTAPALPEEVAWNMVFVEGGFLAVAVVILWRVVARFLEEARTQNKMLVETQAVAIGRLSDAMIRVEGAIQTSDQNNMHAIGRLSDTVQAAMVRLDKHEQKLDQYHDSLLHHSNRLSLLENRRTPISSPAVKT